MTKKLIIFTTLILLSLLGACQSTTLDSNTLSEQIDSTTETVDTTTSDGFLTSIATDTLTTYPSTATTTSKTIATCEVQGLSNCDFKIALAKSDRSFEIVETYSDLSDAQEIFHTYSNPNYVLLDQEDKVNSMKYGAVNFKTKSITETTTLGHVGFRNPTYLNGNYNVDGVYLDTDGILVYGVIAGVHFEVLKSEVELIPDIFLHNAYSYYSVSNQELIHTISYGLSSADFQSIGAIDIAPDYLVEGTRYYCYDNHYFYDNFYQMTDDFRNETFEHAINSENPYYNYYQYLSFRSKTQYTAEELNAYISSNVGTSSGLYDTGDDFIAAQSSVYINAAMELAFAIHESGWGNSWIAINKNNLFGINAIDSDPYNSATAFDTVQDCIEYHVQYMMGARYFNPKYSVSYGTNFGNKYQGINYKYASDAFWGEKIAKHYYNLDKALGFKDRNYYHIAVLDPTAVGYYGPNTQGPIVYDPSTYTYRGLFVVFAVMKETTEFYQLRLPLALNDEYTMDISIPMGPTDVFYVEKQYITIVND